MGITLPLKPLKSVLYSRQIQQLVWTYPLHFLHFCLPQPGTLYIMGFTWFEFFFLSDKALHIGYLQEEWKWNGSEEVCEVIGLKFF